jgi:hypothetical protein
MSRKRKVPPHKWVFGTAILGVGIWGTIAYPHQDPLIPLMALAMLAFIFLVP